MDALQLVSPHVTVIQMRRGLTDLTEYTPDEVMSRYGLRPDQIVDYKALRGDASDNIPGVPGIGEKGAVTLLQAHGDLEGVYQHLAEIPEKKRHLLETHQREALLSKELAQAATDLDLVLELEHSRVGRYDRERAVSLLRELEFKSLLTKLPPALDSPDRAAQIQTARRRLQFETVTSEQALAALVKRATASPYFAFDTETSSLDPLEAELVGVSLSCTPGEGYYIPVGHKRGKQLSKDRVLKLLKPLFCSSTLKIAHNLKFDLTTCERFGLSLARPYFDTMLAAYLLSPGSRTGSLSDLAFSEFGEEMQPITELIGIGKSQSSFAEVGIGAAAYYAAEDAETTLRLYQ